VIFRISSLAALVCAVSAPVWLAVTGSTAAIWVAAVMAALIWWKHRGNIQRLRGGTEPRIGAK